jgi:carboxymethylenebutenolidase
MAVMAASNLMKSKITFLTVLLFAGISFAAEPWAVAKLDKSTRHGEWVVVTNGTRPVECWVVYPEVKDKATAVVLIHDIFGLGDWAREVTDEVAAAGYIAIMPDLLSGAAPNGGKASDFTNTSAIGPAIRKLPASQVTGDLNAAADYVKALAAANGKVVVAGFCWGGDQSFRFACNRPDLKAAFVFYGTAPSAENLARIQCPVYGFYAGNDGRVTITVTDTNQPNTKDLMKQAGKTYEPVIYDGAGHGFMKGGEDPAGRDGDKKARDAAWTRWQDLLKKI